VKREEKEVDEEGTKIKRSNEGRGGEKKR